MKNTPICSVVMAVYNGEETLNEAIDSILNQTFKEFEFIIVNDASNDETESIIKSYNDPRIKYIKNDENKFLGPSLNEGIKIAKGKYIVRMDADDISYPYRIERQFKFMEENPEVGIAGSWGDVFGLISGELIYETDDLNIKLKLLYQFHIIHPSIIIRSDLVFKNKLFYHPSLQHSEDYDLFVRAFKLTKFANINQKLIKYRATDTSQTRESDEFRNRFYNQTKIDLFEMLGMEASVEEILLFRSIAHHSYKQDKKFIDDSRKLLETMLKSNEKTRLYPVGLFNNHISLFWMNICLNTALINGPYVLRSYLNSPLKKHNKKKKLTIIKLFIKSYLRIN
jgi:glycosyltransferase involved in cell wall biosynthesis